MKPKRKKKKKKKTKPGKFSLGHFTWVSLQVRRGYFFIVLPLRRGRVIKPLMELVGSA